MYFFTHKINRHSGWDLLRMDSMPLPLFTVKNIQNKYNATANLRIARIRKSTVVHLRFFCIFEV